MLFTGVPGRLTVYRVKTPKTGFFHGSEVSRITTGHTYAHRIQEKHAAFLFRNRKYLDRIASTIPEVLNKQQEYTDDKLFV